MTTKTFTTASGIELPLCQVSQIDLIPLEALFNEGQPKPPLEEVDTADGKKMIPNPARADYKEELARFETRRSIYGLATIIELGVEVELTDEQLAAVEKARKKMARIYPKSEADLENTLNVFLYVKSICPTMDEINQLASAIIGLNMPTAGQVQEHLDSFRPGVPGAETDGDQDTAVGDRVAVAVN